MKQNQLLTTCLTLSLLLMAMAVYSDNTSFPLSISNDLVLKDGVYFGAAGGYDNYNMSNNINSVSIITNQSINPNILPPPPISLRLNQIVSTNDGLGGIFLGYGRSFPQYKAYLGIEIFGNWTDTESTSSALVQQSFYANGMASNLFPGYYLSSQSVASTIQVKNNFGFSIRPKIKLHKSNLLYISLGYGLSTISINQAINTTVSFQNVIYNVTPVGSAINNSNQSHSIGGFAYGLGLEQAIYKTWSLRAEYLRTNYNDFNTNSIDSSLRASDNRYMLGIIYHI